MKIESYVKYMFFYIIENTILIKQMIAQTYAVFEMEIGNRTSTNINLIGKTNVFHKTLDGRRRENINTNHLRR